MCLPVSGAAPRIVLHNELAELDRLGNWLQRMATRTALPTDVSFAIQICAEEAVANIIMYGSDTPRQIEIAVELSRQEGAWLVHVEDNGRPFDPTSVPQRPLPGSLRQTEVGNVGVQLMRSFAEQMLYARERDRNHLTLKFTDAGGEPLDDSKRL